MYLRTINEMVDMSLKEESHGRDGKGQEFGRNIAHELVE